MHYLERKVREIASNQAFAIALTTLIFRNCSLLNLVDNVLSHTRK